MPFAMGRVLATIRYVFTCVAAAVMAASFAGCGASSASLTVVEPLAVKNGETDAPHGDVSRPNDDEATPSATATQNDVAAESTVGKTAGAAPSKDSKATDPVTTTGTGTESPVIVKPEQVLGKWQDSFFGTRTLIFAEDSKATMILDLDFAGRLLYGPKLEFDMTWKLGVGKITLTAIDGRPAQEAKQAMKTWGDKFEYELLRVADNEVEIRRCDGTTCYVLKRVQDDAPAKPDSAQN